MKVELIITIPASPADCSFSYVNWSGKLPKSKVYNKRKNTVWLVRLVFDSEKKASKTYACMCVSVIQAFNSCTQAAFPTQWFAYVSAENKNISIHAYSCTHTYSDSHTFHKTFQKNRHAPTANYS